MATIADINQEARDLVDADTTSYTAATLLRRINHAYETVIGWLINASGMWQFDDSNYTDQPRGKFTLVEGQEVYSFASDYLQIEGMDILDLDGITYRKLKPLDHTELGGLSPDEYFGLESNGNPKKGIPEYYDLFTDDSFRLYPAPTATSVTLTNGGRVWFKRRADLFTSAQVTTGTKEPGFASPWHYILSYMAAIPYAQLYKKDRVPLFEKRVMDMKKEIIDHYGRRDKDKRKVATMKRVSFR